MAESVSKQMDNILSAFTKELKDDVDDAGRTCSKGTAQQLRSTSAKKTGEYASGWSCKKTGPLEYTAYNRKMPGLTHLLENGHAIVNAKGEWGRTAGDHKIADAEAKFVSEYIEMIERDL